MALTESEAQELAALESKYGMTTDEQEELRILEERYGTGATQEPQETTSAPSVPDVQPAVTASPAPSQKLSHKASNWLKKDEGYSSNLTANVPSNKSGVTIAGLDLSIDPAAKIKILEEVGVDSEYLKAVSKAKGKKGKEASKVFDAIGQPSMTDEQIAEAQDKFVEKKVRPWLEKKIGKALYNQLPNKIKAAYEALTFLNQGDNTAAAVKKGLKDNDWDDAIKELRNYWKNPTPHNKERSDRVADLIEEVYG